MPRTPLASVLARDIMQRKLISAEPDQPLVELRHVLVESQITGAPVIQSGKLVGIISRSDLVRVEEMLETLDAEVSDREEWLDDQADGFKHPAPRDFVGFRQRLAKLRVKDAMRTQVITCAPDTPVAEIADEMVRQHVHRIVVVEGDRPVGIVSSLDIAALIARGSSDE